MEDFHKLRPGRQLSHQSASTLAWAPEFSSPTSRPKAELGDSMSVTSLLGAVRGGKDRSSLKLVV